jgi:hypothetical protein
LNIGPPVFQSMLGKPGNKRVQAAISLAIQSQIEGVPYVVGASNVAFSFKDGQFSFSANVRTVFGPIAITNLPASTASLDT